MSSEVDPSMWKWLADHLWAPLSAAVGAIWLMLNNRISAVEKKVESSVQKDDFREYIERDTEAHEQLRHSIGKVFDKIDELKLLLMNQNGRRRR